MTDQKVTRGIDGNVSPIHYELLDDGWNCPPDDEFVFTQPIPSSSPEKIGDVVLIKDVPRLSALDDKRRFTFDLSDLTENSLKLDQKSYNQSVYGSSNQDLISGENNAAEDLNIATGRKRRRQQVPLSVQNEFFGVYCLISRSTNKYFKNRCYIGYTVDPNRRIRQHNAGKQFGGAGKTDHRGPWDMICIIHGFPNSISALRFEWAWQNPEKSRRLRALGLKKQTKETAFAFRIRIVCHMLNNDPWKRLALTFRWLLPTEGIPFPSDILPPPHVVIEYGLVEKTVTVVSGDDQEYECIKPCSICSQLIISLEELLRCVSTNRCNSHFHSRCLAKKALEVSGELSHHLFPVTGNCPVCKTPFRWGDLVRDQRALKAAVSAKKTQSEGICNLHSVPKVLP